MFKPKFSDSGGAFPTKYSEQNQTMSSEFNELEILKGEDGFSPIVAVEEIDDGHLVAITDKNGTTTFEVLDGKVDYSVLDDYSKKTEVTEEITKHNSSITAHEDIRQKIDNIKVPTKVSEFDNDRNYLTSETDPTVPDWAKAENKPVYTADEIGASNKNHTHSVEYTPEGTIDALTIEVTPNILSVNSITDSGAAPSLEHSKVKASNITSWNAGSLPSLVFDAGALPSADLNAGSGSAGISSTISSTDPQVANKRVTLTLSHTHEPPSLSFYAGSLPTTTFEEGDLPSLGYSSVAADNISEWSAGAKPTTESIDVVTGIKSITSSQPKFVGTKATITTTVEK